MALQSSNPSFGTLPGIARAGARGARKARHSKHPNTRRQLARRASRGARPAYLRPSAVAALLALALALALAPRPASAGLFGSIEFGGPDLPGWQAFAPAVSETLELLHRCETAPRACPRDDVGALLGELRPVRRLDGRGRLEAINRLANRRPYASDAAAFGRRDHWAAPLEFLAGGGDCEDYAILKYTLLRHLGVPAERLRIVLLRSTDGGIGHAVLAATLGGGVHILDNVSDRLRSQPQLSRFRAFYSFNEVRRWAHFTPS